MRVILQRVTQASVCIEQKETRSIGSGFMLLVGFHSEDTEEIVKTICDKIVHLRIFTDEQDKMNHSLLDVQGDLLVVSNFTLYANCRKGRRPSFVQAARPEQAIPLYEYCLQELSSHGLVVKSGEFGADMLVDIKNDGPVTIILDSDEIC